MVNTVKVRIPGTTANCGPGFDTIGMACTIYNELELTLSRSGSVEILVSGEGSNSLPKDERNIVIRAIRKVLAAVNSPYQGIRLVMDNKIPLSRGLGSSAAAIVGGLVAANAATGNTLSNDVILNMATEMEGHPDNVAPALFGGIAISVANGKDVHCMHFSPVRPLSMVVAVPEFSLSTHKARSVLPVNVPLKDAIFNVSRTAMLVSALCSGKYDYLMCALDDKLHQPYREVLIPGMKAVFMAASEAGALGSVISGAGPCLIAFTEKNDQKIGEAMVKAFADNGVKASYLLLQVDTAGAQVLV
ncbi:MAG: Homoserine kinase [Firmicutes bacterium]|nr:Homoserine kinase [Bacillota bacterium]